MTVGFSMQPQSRVLCVDRDKYQADLVGHVLRREGYGVDAVESAATALRAIEKDPPDLVILDLSLPDMDGLKLCRRVHRTYGIPVLVFTARSAEQDMIGAFLQGADDYVVKPSNMKILMCRVRVLLNRRRLVLVPPVPNVG